VPDPSQKPEPVYPLILVAAGTESIKRGPAWLGYTGSGLLQVYDLVVEVTWKPAPVYSARATSVA
jgi:hypothetical protein